jgi:hypothetical protein
MNVSSKLAILMMGSCVACGAESGENLGISSRAVATADFDVDFAGCSEVAGIGFVPRANARPLVPAEYELAGDAENAVMVVRAVKCDAVSVAGHSAEPSTLTQIGITVTGQDPSADINNYTLWYISDQPLLTATLTAAGASAEQSQHISYTRTAESAGESLDFVATPSRAPAHELHGPVVTPTAAAVPFTATWWAETARGSLRMRTVIPSIAFGGASMTLSTPAESSLGKLIGAPSLTFALLDSYNTFASAQMHVQTLD